MVGLWLLGLIECRWIILVRRRESEWEFMSCATIFEILIGWSGLKLIVNAMVVGFVRQHAVKI